MEQVQYQAQPMAQPISQPQVQPNLGQPLTINDYIGIIKKRKKMILILTIVFVIMIIMVMTFSKGGNEINSLIALAGEKGELGPIVEQQLILEGSDVIESVITQNFEEPLSLNEFKTNHMTVELVRERVDRTKEQLVSFLSLTTKADTKERAKKINDDLVKRFFEIIEPRYGEQRTIKEKIKVLESEEKDLKEYIKMIEQVTFESSQEIENAEEIISKFKTQVDSYINSLKDENIKGKTLNHYPLIHKKALNDIDRFNEKMIEAEEATWHSVYREEATNRFIKELNGYEKKLTSKNLSQMQIEEFILIQFEMQESLKQFRDDVVGNATKDDFNGEQAMQKLLNKRRLQSSLEMQKVQLTQDLLIENNAYSVLSSPSLASSLTSSSNTVIKVSKDYKDIYSALEAQELLTSSQIVEPVVIEYSDMNFANFVERNMNVEKVKVATNQGNNQILPFIKIDLAGPSPEESKQMLQDVLDNFFTYVNENNNYAEKVSLIEEKIELKEDEINNVKVDVSLFEADITGQNMTKLRKLSLLKTKLLLSDYKKRLSDISTEKIKQQDKLKKQGTYNLVSAPLNIQEPGEKFAPSKGGAKRLGLAVFVALFISVFLVLAYEIKFPEYQAKYAQFLQAQKVMQGSVQQSTPQPIQASQPAQQVPQPQPIQQPPPIPQPAIQPVVSPPIAGESPVIEKKPFFQNLFSNKTKDVYYMSKNDYSQTTHEQGTEFEALTQLKTNKLKNSDSESEVMNKIKKELKAI